jgi:hypothetical protein
MPVRQMSSFHADFTAASSWDHTSAHTERHEYQHWRFRNHQAAKRVCAHPHVSRGDSRRRSSGRKVWRCERARRRCRCAPLAASDGRPGSGDCGLCGQMVAADSARSLRDLGLAVRRCACGSCAGLLSGPLKTSNPAPEGGTRHADTPTMPRSTPDGIVLRSGSCLSQPLIRPPRRA